MSIFSSKKTYELSMTKSYVSSWHVVEAVRELLQNAIDSADKFEFNIGGANDRRVLAIHSRSSTLTPQTLLLGSSTKANDESKVGQFGEGYKLALLVLLREGYSVKIFNGTVQWTPAFKYSSTYKESILTVEETKLKRTYEGLTFIIEGLTNDDISKIIASCLHMQKYDVLAATSYGEILYNDNHNGNLYVNGLFVCQTTLKYGYNIKPQYLKLERDRQTVSSFDLQFLVKDMWLETEYYNRITDMLDAKADDVRYINYSSIPSSGLQSHVAQQFREKYPRAVAVTSQQEMEEAKAQGYEEAVIVPETTMRLIERTTEYQRPLQNRVQAEVYTPYQILEEYWVRNKRYMRRQALVNFKELLKVASSWKA